MNSQAKTTRTIQEVLELCHLGLKRVHETGDYDTADLYVETIQAAMEKAEGDLDTLPLDNHIERLCERLRRLADERAEIERREASIRRELLQLVGRPHGPGRAVVWERTRTLGRYAGGRVCDDQQVWALVQSGDSLALHLVNVEHEQLDKPISGGLQLVESLADNADADTERSLQEPTQSCTEVVA